MLISVVTNCEKVGPAPLPISVDATSSLMVGIGMPPVLLQVKVTVAPSSTSPEGNDLVIVTLDGPTGKNSTYM